MMILNHLKSITLKITKPSIRNDKLLIDIDLAPYYQCIPETLFAEEKRVKYLKWRNRQVVRRTNDRSAFLNLKRKSVLDLGCNIGYFGWKHCELIRSYLGVDSDFSCTKAATSIKQVLGYEKINFLNMDVVEYIQTSQDHFDTCLFFSIYHHLMYQLGFEGAQNVLYRLNRICNELYFDMGQKNEPSNPARSKWHNILPEEDPEVFIKREVLTNTVFNGSEVIGETLVGNSKRLLFRFTK